MYIHTQQIPNIHITPLQAKKKGNNLYNPSCAVLQIDGCPILIEVPILDKDETNYTKSGVTYTGNAEGGGRYNIFI